MVIQKKESLKYNNCLIRIWWKITADFVMMSCVNVTVMLDQVLEEGIGKDSIARKTIQPRFTLQQDCSFLHW